MASYHLLDWNGAEHKLDNVERVLQRDDGLAIAEKTSPFFKLHAHTSVG